MSQCANTYLGVRCRLVVDHRERYCRFWNEFGSVEWFGAELRRASVAELPHRRRSEVTRALQAALLGDRDHLRHHEPRSEMDDRLDALGYAWAPIAGSSLLDPDWEDKAITRRREIQMYAELGLEAHIKDRKIWTDIGDW